MKILWLAPFPLSELSNNLPGYYHNSPSKGMWLLNLLNELIKFKDLEVHVVTYTSKIKHSIKISQGNLIYHIVKHGIPFINKGYPNYFPVHKAFRYPFLKRKLWKIINSIDPDLIHVHGTEDVYGLVPLLTKIPVIVSMQGIIGEIYLRNKTLSHFFQRRIEVKCLREYTNFGCRTDFDKNFVMKSNPDSIVHYLPEAINPIFYNVTYELKEDKIINFIGSVSKAKGMIILILALVRVYEHFPDTKLNIVGSINNREYKEFSKLISNNNLSENIIFHGFKTPEEILQLHLKARLFVLPTLMDNSPNSLCEAMALGMPCIASRVGGIPSLINDRIDGLMFEPGDINELAEKIIFLLSDLEYSRKLGENAKEIAFNRNHPGEVAKTSIAVYNSIISLRSCFEIS